MKFSSQKKKSVKSLFRIDAQVINRLIYLCNKDEQIIYVSQYFSTNSLTVFMIGGGLGWEERES